MSRHVILGVVLLSLFGPGARAQVPLPRDLLPTRTALSRVGLERNWMAAVPLVGTERLLEISLADNLLFTQTDEANFTAYDAESGRRLWSTNLGRHSSDVHPASVNSRLVFVTNSNLLYALDRTTGRTVWVENLHILPTSSTACDEDHVMVGLNTGLLRGFDLREFDSKGNIKKDESGRPILATRVNFAWNWQTGGPLTSRPLAAGRLIAFGGHDGRAYVALSEKATMVYRIATGGQIFAPLSSYGTRTLLIPSADKNVYAVDLFTASVNWTFASGAPVMQEPLVANDDAYVVNTAGVLSAVDVHSGTPRWSSPTFGGRLVSVSGTRIYLESHDGDLFIVDRASGRLVAEPRMTFVRAGLNLRPYELETTNSLNDRLYMATRSGMVLCLREIGQYQPRLLHDPKAPPFGYIPPEGIVEPTTPPAASAPADEDAAAAKDENAAPDAEKEKELPKEEEAPK